MLSDEIIRESSFYQEILEEGLEKGIQKGIEKGLEKGIQQGIQQGIQEGVQAGLTRGHQEILRDLVAIRFPDLTLPAGIEALGPDALRSLVRNLLTATDLDAARAAIEQSLKA
jgi:hypothetical protein